MTEFERLTLTVVAGLAIDRASLLALVQRELPSCATATEGEDTTGESIALVDIDRFGLDDVGAVLSDLSRCHTGLVVLSASDALETVRAVLRLPRAAFVWKGDEPEELAAAVVSIASGRAWISESVRRRFLETGTERRPVLSPQESRVMRSYGAGAAVKDVAVDMRIAEHTVRTYIKRIRAKYLEAGVALRSRVDFYRHLHGHDVAVRKGGDRMRADAQEMSADSRGGGIA